MKSSSAIVITVPYVPTYDDVNKTRQRGESAVSTFTRALDAAQDVAPGADVLVVLEQKIQNRAATEGITRVAENRHCIVTPCDEFETVGRWYRGIRRAFSERVRDRVLVLPGDIESVDNKDAFTEAVKSMFEQTTLNALTLGDYVSTDKFKEEFDKHLAHPLLAMAFPSQWSLIVSKAIRKVRSEYFCVGREVFDAFLKQGWRWLPLDATFLLMLAVVSERECKLQKVELGLVKDTPTRNVDAAIQQILRLAFQTWFNCHPKIQETSLESRKLLQKKLLTDLYPIVVKAMLDLLPLVKE